MTTVGSTGQVSLQQFVTANPGAEGLANVLKTKGMSDEEIVALLQKGKEDWLGAGAGVKLPPAGSTASAGDVNQVLGRTSSTELHADIFTFMALFQKMAQEMRQTARLDRETQLQAQVSTLQAQAENMKEAAQARFNAALTSGICQIGAGAVQIGGAVASGSKLGEIKPGMASDKISTISAQAGNRTTGAAGGGQILTGLGQIGAGAFTQEADELDGKNKHLDAAAKMEEEARNKANDVMQQMADIIRDIREKLSAIEQSSVEANRGIARNI